MGSCVSCGGDLEFQRPYDFKSKVFQRVYQDTAVYRCFTCGLSQVDCARVDAAALARYYRAEYRAVANIGTGGSGHDWYRARAQALAALAADSLGKPPRRAFEVGAGYGYNLLAVRERYSDVVLATDELDETIPLASGIQPGALDDGGYDLVILSHVLEHFTDPRGLLARARAALAPFGVVIVEVPNDVPGIFPLNGPDEPHLTFFTEETLKALVGEGGEVFAAGPPYQPKSLARRLRKRVAPLLHRLPITSGLLASRRRGIVNPDNFSTRRRDGAFLRAVIRRAS